MNKINSICQLNIAQKDKNQGITNPIQLDYSNPFEFKPNAYLQSESPGQLNIEYSKNAQNTFSKTTEESKFNHNQEFSKQYSNPHSNQLFYNNLEKHGMTKMDYKFYSEFQI